MVSEADEYAKMYPIKGNKDNADFQAIASILEQFVESGGEILKELVRTAQANPLVGIFLVYLMTDYFEKKQIMNTSSANAIRIIIAASAGVQLGSEIATVLSAFVPNIRSGATVPNILTPSISVLVNSNDSSVGTSAILKKVIPGQ